MIGDPRRKRIYLWAAGILVMVLISGAGLAYVVKRRAGEEGLYRTAEAYWEQGKYQDAAQYYERLLSLYPRGKFRAKVLLDAANTYYYYLRNAHRAIDLYRIAIADSPDAKTQLYARRCLGEIYLRDVGDLSQALEEYSNLRREEQADKERQEVSFTLGEIHFRRNELAQSLGEFRRVADDPSNAHLQDKANLSIGSIYQLQRKQSSAVIPFEKVLEHTQCAECRHQARLGLVDVYEAEEKFDAALRILSGIGGSAELDDFKKREIKRIEEKRSVLHVESAVNWSDKSAQRPKAKE
jgi:outer membrane protein assembly factor BamD (BamD/ComL family)